MKKLLNLFVLMWTLIIGYQNIEIEEPNQDENRFDLDEESNEYEKFSKKSFTNSEKIRVKKDPMRSYIYAKDLAHAGDTNAMFEVANFHNHHKTHEHKKKALMWYEKAAMGGHKESMIIAGVMNIEGIGKARDTKKAKYWLILAYKNGVKEAKKEILKYKLAQFALSVEPSKHLALIANTL